MLGEGWVAGEGEERDQTKGKESLTTTPSLLIIM